MAATPTAAAFFAEQPSPASLGYRMPGEYEPHERTYMLWPERPDNWRLNAVCASRGVGVDPSARDGRRAVVVRSESRQPSRGPEGCGRGAVTIALRPLAATLV